MKQFFAQHKNGEITFCNYPVFETGAESYEFEVEKSDIDAVQEGTKDWRIEGGALSVVESTRKADAEAEREREKQEQEKRQKDLALLKKKLEKGEATQEEVQFALLNLI
jgi:hypothetical protein